MQSLKPSNNRTVEACDIYLPDDSLAVDGMYDCCQSSPATGYHSVLAWKVEDMEICQAEVSGEKPCKRETGLGAYGHSLLSG